MMSDSKLKVIQGESEGAFGKTMKNIAKAQGFEIGDFSECKLEGNVVDCQQLS